MKAANLTDRGVLRLKGEGLVDFLQGLVTNDMTLLSADKSLYAALLTPQGKYLFDFFIVQEAPDSLLLETGRERLPDLQRKLMLYRLRLPIEIDDVSNAYVVTALFDGPETGTEGATRQEGSRYLFWDPRSARLGQRLIAPADGPLPDADVVGLADYHAFRLQQGVPDGAQDFVFEKTLALEGGMDKFNGVSFTKGCYVGQEQTARTNYRANLKRKFFVIHGETTLPAPGTPITLKDKEAGEIRSSAGTHGLALLRIEDVEAASDTQPLTAGLVALKAHAL